MTRKTYRQIDLSNLRKFGDFRIEVRGGLTLLLGPPDKKNRRRRPCAICYPHPRGLLHAAMDIARLKPRPSIAGHIIYAVRKFKMDGDA